MPFIQRTLVSSVALALLGLASGHALAQAGADPAAHHGGAATAGADSGQELSEGEVTRWDARSGKITLRHGELKNLGMPPMTMVFALRDPAQAGPIQVGDKVRFRAEQVNGAFVVTQIELAR